MRKEIRGKKKMKVDIVIKNCKVVRPEGITKEGIAVKEGRIVAVASDDCLPEAQRVIDAKGNYAIPGVIDPHVHFGYSHPIDEDTRVDSTAAAYGGVTTVANMIGLEAYRSFAYTDSFTKIFDEWKNIQEKNAFTDFVMDPVIFSEVQINEMALCAKKYGIPIFKMVLTNKGTMLLKGTMPTDDGTLYMALSQISTIGPPARLRLHCENIDVINRLMTSIKDEEGRTDLAAWTDARPGWVEALDVERAACLAKATHAPIYIVHLSSAEGVDAVARAKEEKVDIIAETNPAYLTLTKHSPIGALGKVAPPLKDERSIERLWEGIKLGIVECIGTDNVSNMMEDKKDIWTAALGFSEIENYLPIMLSEGVNKGRINLEKLVEVCCANNAKAMGIYPKKGVIGIGSDADIVIVDLNKKGRISNKNLHHLADYTIFEGWEVQGYPLLTMLRGNIVVEDGKLLAREGIGRYLPR
jgi:dihydropyrimidinase